jgi:site-specific DNA-methyltransferase (adenine-specific)
VNQLFFGDNLDVLRESIKDESVDLVYLDPPFNSKRDYNQIFKAPDGSQSHAQIEAFEDTWHWGEEAELELKQIMHGGNTDVADLIDAFSRFLGKNDMLAYLVMMANRLLELHRVLKPTGSLYLHCDPTASHYLKLVLDGVFGPERFGSEIVWKRTSSHGNVSKGYGAATDTIYYYTKSSQFVWNQIYVPYSQKHIDTKFTGIDPDGRRYTTSDLRNPGDRPNLKYPYTAKNGNTYQPHPNGWAVSIERMKEYEERGLLYFPASPEGRLRLKRYLDEAPGEKVQNLWDDISPINSQAQERLGYPTQKPLALLERIISASTNSGDVVLDPFCGCGTAVDAAQKLGRPWIGIDITHLAISLIEKRLKDRYKGITFEVHGTPKDLAGAHDLARRDKYQFQWWACSLVDSQPYQGKKKGADSGIDGLIFFADVEAGEEVNRRILVSVKGGENVKVDMIRDLKGTMEREKAPIGLFVTLAEPTKPMREEAAKAGFYRGGNGKEYPKLQILTIAELLDGRKRPEFPDMSMGSLTFKKAKREKIKSDEPTPLFEEN